MSERRANKKRFRSDGTSIWTRRSVDGPGVWVTCIRGKERQTVGEVYDLFEMESRPSWGSDVVSAERGPVRTASDASEDRVESKDDELDVEKAIAREVDRIKRPRREQLFANCRTDTQCMLFISCKPPVDPVILVEQLVQRVAKTGVTHTRNAQRFTPISGSCDANLAEIESLAQRIIVPVFERYSGVGRGGAGWEQGVDASAQCYKIELRIRNHNTVTRDDVIHTVAACVPSSYRVDLHHPDLFVLVEIFRGTCGMSVVRDYYHYKKFNTIEVAHTCLPGTHGETEQRASTGTRVATKANKDPDGLAKMHTSEKSKNEQIPIDEGKPVKGHGVIKL